MTPLNVDILPRHATGFDVLTYTDSPEKQTVDALVSIYFGADAPSSRRLRLWDAKSYAAAGDWTEEQARARITELLKAEAV